ncbi:hypothetical protein COY62_00475 [bacterium (Candidatus Howlettbacteria) CG_4_10_14_0_8_um_filter_40_9]|nr:MAG: hypothetical protein COY62_00475 [bacterium (Candidatus Howlettbacteria) CG_4_10_14_0_8_um_filter_40_9]
MKNILLFSILIFTIPALLMMVMRHGAKHVMHPFKTLKHLLEIAVFCAVVFTIYYLYTHFGAKL